MPCPQSPQGNGIAVSLQLITVGKRHCRFLYHSGAAGIGITSESGNGSAVSLQLITVGKRQCRFLYHSGAAGIGITSEY